MGLKERDLDISEKSGIFIDKIAKICYNFNRIAKGQKRDFILMY